MKTGSVSWIKRGTYLENARILENKVDFVELLVYTWNDELQRQLLDELDGLGKLKLFYTVHLPTDTIENCERAYYFFKENCFPVRNHVLHPLDGWESFIGEKDDVSLENLIHAYPVYKRMTIDIGHLLLSGRKNELLDDTRLQEVREIHLHGVFGSKDHCLLNSRTLSCFRKLRDNHPGFFTLLQRSELLVNFEIFELRAFLASLGRFRKETLF